MTDKSQKDHELIRRYLAGRLTDEEEGMLETRIVEDAQFRNELDLTAAIRDGMRELEARGEIDGLLDKARTRWQRPTIAIAASLIALVVASILIFYLVDRSQPPRPPIALASLHFERTRGLSSDNAVNWTLGADPTQLRLHFDVGAAPAANYRVVVLRGTGDSAEPVITAVEATSAGGDVVLTLSDSLLTPGDFEIRLSPVPETAGVGATVYHLVVTDR